MFEKFKTETLGPLKLLEDFEKKFKSELEFLTCVKYDHWSQWVSYFYWQVNQMRYPSVSDFIHVTRFLKQNIGNGLNVRMDNGRYIAYIVNDDLSLTENFDIGSATTQNVYYDFKDLGNELKV